MDNIPDKQCLEEIYSESKGYYSGQWIEAAQKYSKAENFLDAAFAYERARDGFGKRSPEWQCLEAWRAYMASKALQRSEPMMLVTLQDSFYQQFDVSTVPLPLSRDDIEAIIRHDGLSFAAITTSLRYYLLENPEKIEEYTPVIVRMAYEAGLYEGLYGDFDSAEHYFSLAQHYGWQDIMVDAIVAGGYMAIGDYDKALEEYEEVHRSLRRRDNLVPNVWLATAKLCFDQGRTRKGRNIVNDYIDRAEVSPLASFEELVQYGLRWSIQNGAEPKMIAMLAEHVWRE